MANFLAIVGTTEEPKEKRIFRRSAEEIAANATRTNEILERTSKQIKDLIPGVSIAPLEGLVALHIALPDDMDIKTAQALIQQNCEDVAGFQDDTHIKLADIEEGEIAADLIEVKPVSEDEILDWLGPGPNKPVNFNIIADDEETLPPDVNTVNFGGPEDTGPPVEDERFFGEPADTLKPIDERDEFMQTPPVKLWPETDAGEAEPLYDPNGHPVEPPFDLDEETDKK